MNILHKIDYKLHKVLQQLGISYKPSIETYIGWLRRTTPFKFCYYFEDGVLLYANTMEERLARQYCTLAHEYAPKQEYVIFDPAHLAQNGPWKRAHIEYCLPPARYINLRHTSVAFMEEAIRKPHTFEAKGWAISLPDEELHKLALLFTDYYAQGTFSSTDFCNLQCTMCFYHSEDTSGNMVRFAKERRHNITKHQIEDDLAYAFLDQIAPGKVINFACSGEFFMHKHWREYFAYAFNKGLVPQIITNGLLLTKDNADFCVEHGLKWAIFSIDGYDKRSYENVRVGSNFETVLNNLEYLFKKNKVFIRVNSLMFPELQNKKTVITELFADKAHAVSLNTVRIDQYSNSKDILRQYEDSDLCYELLMGIILMSDGRYAPCCGVLNAISCVEFPWLVDSRKVSFIDARNIYAEMLFDEHTPFFQFCKGCKLKWQSYYYNGKHAFDECIPLVQYNPE